MYIATIIITKAGMGVKVRATGLELSKHVAFRHDKSVSCGLDDRTLRIKIIFFTQNARHMLFHRAGAAQRRKLGGCPASQSSTQAKRSTPHEAVCSFFGAGDRTLPHLAGRCPARLKNALSATASILRGKNGILPRRDKASKKGRSDGRRSFKPKPPDQKRCPNEGAPFWCGRQDLNLHTERRKILNLMRLPIPPRPRAKGERDLPRQASSIIPHFRVFVKRKSRCAAQCGASAP